MKIPWLLGKAAPRTVVEREIKTSHLLPVAAHAVHGRIGTLNKAEFSTQMTMSCSIRIRVTCM